MAKDGRGYHGDPFGHMLNRLGRRLKRIKPNLKQYEITFKTPKGREEEFAGEYGFGNNPPHIVNARNRKHALEELDMERVKADGVKIRSVKEAP